MPDPPTRRFTLGDVMILVAASAVALMLLRRLHDLRSPIPGASLSWVWYWGTEAAPFVPTFALALLAMRLREPRPGLRDALTQPGAAACVTVVAATLLRVIAMVTSTTVRGLLRPSSGVMFGVESYASRVMFIGDDVAFVWAALYFVRAWRPEPHWIDRTGRAFGWFMIGLLLLAYLGI